MYHTLRFIHDLTVDLAISPRQPLERLRIGKGSRLVAQVRPYVVDGDDGPVEVADLFFANGTSALGIAFANFTFADR
jgi:hypothetical protein